jgi:hypothetical protein
MSGFAGNVAFKRAVVDLHSALISINGSTLEVACPPRGIGAKKVQESSETRFRTTYIASAVALERAGVDLGICTKSMNSSAQSRFRFIRDETRGMDLHIGTIIR